MLVKSKSSSGSCKTNISVSIGRNIEILQRNELNVHVRLEGSLNRQTQVFSLCFRQLRQLGVDVIQMQQSDLLIQDLGQDVYSDLFLSSLTELDIALAERLILGLEQHYLGEHLIGEGA